MFIHSRKGSLSWALTSLAALMCTSTIAATTETKHFDISAFVGPTSSDIEISGQLDETTLYRTSSENCDLNNFSSCDNPNLDVLEGNFETFTDNALTDDQKAFYTFEVGSTQKTTLLDPNTTPLERNAYFEPISFNGKIWILGGITPSGIETGKSNNIWSSEDGINWVKQVSQSPIIPFTDPQAVVFNDQIWILTNAGTYSGECPMQAWSTSNGIDWTLKSEDTGFADCLSVTELVVFENKIWALGRFGDSRKIYNSDDGVTWNRVSQIAPLPKLPFFGAVVFEDRIWALSDQATNNVYSSADGATWTLEADVPLLSEAKPYNVVLKDNQFVIISSNETSQNMELLTSTDGITWSASSLSPSLPFRTFATPLVHKDDLWLIGGTTLEIENNVPSWTFRDDYIQKSVNNIDWESIPSNLAAGTLAAGVYFNNKFWAFGGFINRGTLQNSISNSVDGINWQSIPSESKFTPLAGSAVATLNNQLFLIGGISSDNDISNEIWSSEDGINWSLITGATEFDPKLGHSLINHNNKLFLAGGIENYEGVLTSIDGTNWTAADRGIDESSSLVTGIASFNDKVWTVNVSIDSETGNITNKILTSVDGINWAIESSNISDFTPRFNFSKLIVVDNKLVLIGGIDENETAATDILFSYDGIEWTSVPSSGAFAGEFISTVENGNSSISLGGVNYLSNTINHDRRISTDGTTWKTIQKYNTSLSLNKFEVKAFNSENSELITDAFAFEGQNLVLDLTPSEDLEITDIAGSCAGALNQENFDYTISNITSDCSINVTYGAFNIFWLSVAGLLYFNRRRLKKPTNRL